MSECRRYAQVGTGGRHKMFREAITDTFSESSDLVALCDTNAGRLELARAQVKEKTGSAPPGYSADDFDRMIEETRPDCVIVTCMDSAHDLYIVRAMEAGCDVITEKPMTIDEKRCQRILDTAQQTGRECRVTFNYRYAPPRTQVKDLLMSGVIGDIKSVDFHWMLDTHHGADYFRRWHRHKKNSGVLLVHKSTHHFDLVNWYLGSTPERVFASGRRCFYTPEMAERLGLVNRGERCYHCPEAAKCALFLDIAKEGQADVESELRDYYFNCEKHDGYFRDRCVFAADMDIEDSISVCVDYKNGVRLSYSLNAFSAWEGYQIVFNGSKGRLEHKCEESVYINGDGSIPGELKREGTWTRIYPLREPAYEVEVWSGAGGHGGGDTVLLEDVFALDRSADKYLRAADERSGAWSILVGIAANHSMQKNVPVRIDELVQGLEEPDYAPMPSDTEPLDIPRQ